MLVGRNFGNSILWVMSLSFSATHFMQHSKSWKMYLLFGVWSVVCGWTKRTCTHKITNFPTQVNISDNLYFLWNCKNMYTLLILDKDKYLICSLRITERIKCGHSMSIKTSTLLKHQSCQNINHAKTLIMPKKIKRDLKKKVKVIFFPPRVSNFYPLQLFNVISNPLHWQSWST